MAPLGVRTLFSWYKEPWSTRERDSITASSTSRFQGERRLTELVVLVLAQKIARVKEMASGVDEGDSTGAVRAIGHVTGWV